MQPSRRIVKLACLAGSVLLASTITFSHFRYVQFHAPHVSTFISRGRLGIGTSRLPGAPVRDSTYFMVKRIEPHGPFLPWFDSYVSLGAWNMIVIPLWLPMGCLTLLTVVFFIRDRARRLEHHCRKCSYDLTGNESGVCPECGTTVEHDLSR